MTVVADLQQTVAEAAESVGPSVVGLGRGWGLGSGVVIAAGQVLTNAHAVRRDEVTVRNVLVRLGPPEEIVALESSSARSTSGGFGPAPAEPATTRSPWGAIEIIPTSASKPGILAGVAAAIAEAGISVRQVIVDDPEVSDDPHAFIVTEQPVPERLLPRIRSVDGVKSVVLH